MGIFFNLKSMIRRNEKKKARVNEFINNFYDDHKSHINNYGLKFTNEKNIEYIIEDLKFIIYNNKTTLSEDDICKLILIYKVLDVLDKMI